MHQMLRTKLNKKLGASLPDKLNRPAWFLDFPKWQEMKGAWNNNHSELRRHNSQQAPLLQEGGEENDGIQEDASKFQATGNDYDREEDVSKFRIHADN